MNMHAALSGTQSAYNVGDENEDSKPYENNVGSETASNSVDSQDLPGAQDMKWEGVPSDYRGNEGVKNGAGA